MLHKDFLYFHTRSFVSYDIDYKVIEKIINFRYVVNKYHIYLIIFDAILKMIFSR
jgi:hypothetical protein